MSRTKNALHVIFYRAVWFFDLLENQTHEGSLEQGSMTLEHMIMDVRLYIITLELGFTQHPVTSQSSSSKRLVTDYIDKNNGPGSERAHRRIA